LLRARARARICGTKQKALPRQGFFDWRIGSGLLGADDFDFDATIRLQALDQRLFLRSLPRLLHLLPVTGCFSPLPSV
jgi:hypothetical protein